MVRFSISSLVHLGDLRFMTRTDCRVRIRSFKNATKLIEEVNRIKSRKNLLLWYTADESALLIPSSEY